MKIRSILLLFVFGYVFSGSIKSDQPANTIWTGNNEYNPEISLPDQVTVISKDLGIAGHLISHGGSLSYYSKFGLVVNFDPSTNKITSIKNFYGQPSFSGRSAVLDPSGSNSRYPVTKNKTVKYWMDETGVAGHRTSFNETWVYIGAR